jgi:hypothetical protein
MTRMGTMIAMAALLVPAWAQTTSTPAADTAPKPKSEVGRREVRQQKRIAQGVTSGQMTPGETARVERQEGAIRREVKRDRQANGGTLTPREKAKVNRQLNRTSREIRRDKHNAKTAARTK